MNKLFLLLTKSFPENEELLNCWHLKIDESVETLRLSIEEIKRAKTDELIVVVPNNFLSWHKVDLPNGVKLTGDKKLLPILQNLLEDSLLEDVENIHVAVEPKAENGKSALVVACDQTWLATWLKILETAGLKIARCLPEIPPDILKDLDKTAICTGVPHNAWLTTLKDNLPLSLPLDNVSIAVLNINNTRALTQVYNDASEYFSSEHVQLLSNQTYIGALNNSSWDLAQHNFSVTSFIRFRRKIWLNYHDFCYSENFKSMRLASMSLMIILFFGLNFQVLFQNIALKNKQKVINSSITKTFSNIKVILNAEQQIQNELRNLKNQAGILSFDDFQPLMATAGILNKKFNLNPKNIEFSDNELILTNFNNLENLEENLNQELEELGNNYYAELEENNLYIRVN